MSDPVHSDSPSACPVIDRLMDTVLREQATRGSSADEVFLARVEEEIDRRAVQPLRLQRGLMVPWIWGAGIAAALATGGFVAFRPAGIGNAATVAKNVPTPSAGPQMPGVEALPNEVIAPAAPTTNALAQAVAAPAPELPHMEEPPAEVPPVVTSPQSPTEARIGFTESSAIRIVAQHARFDPSTNTVALEEGVELDTGDFNLTCDVLVVEFDLPQPNQKAAFAETSAGRFRSITAQGYVVLQRSTPAGSIVAKARHATYDPATGNVTLRDYPVLDDSKNLVRGKEANTTIILAKDGPYRVNGPATFELVTAENRLPRRERTALRDLAPPLQPDADSNRLVATVNGHPITLSEIRKAIAIQNLIQSSREEKSPSSQEIEEQALQNLVDRILIVGAFKKPGSALRPQFVDEAVARLVRDKFTGDEVKFALRLKESGVTRDEFRAYLEETIILQAMRAKHADSIPVEVPPAEIEDFWKANQSRFASPRSVTLRTITLPKLQNGDASSAAEQKALAETLRQELQSGADFGEIARSYSIDSGAQHDGFRGTFIKSDLAPALAEAAFAVPVKTISPVIDYEDYLLLIFVESRDAEDIRKIEDPTVRDEIQQLLRAKKRQENADRWLDQLRREAKIHIYQP